MKNSIVIVTLLCYLSVFSQVEKKIILDYFKASATKQKLNSQDVADISIITASQLANSKTYVYYVNQSYNGILIENATANVILKDNRVIDATQNFLANLGANISSTSANKSTSTIQDVVVKALKLKNYEHHDISKIESLADNQYKVFLTQFPNFPIYVDLVYALQTNGSYDLVYNVELYSANLDKLYLIKLRASDLSVLKDTLLTRSCSQLNHDHASATNISNQSILFKNKVSNTQNSEVGFGSYLVYKSNLSGPLQGDRTLEKNVFDAVASPYGWHDVDGKLGADYTITRGNNVYAYEDKNGRNEPAYSPDGGINLQFVYPYAGPQVNPISYVDASITNLFYVNNKLHDIFYKFGFDENSGNFQENQYGRLSSSSYNSPDPLLAESQDGAGQNNANISVPRDGISPRMQMYLWKPQNPENLFISSPSNLAGYYVSADNAFEPGHIDLPTFPNSITGKVVIVETNEPGNLGCTNLTNSASLQGNIALVVRGTCSFSDKVFHAQQAGAIAAIVMNNVANESLVSMAGEAPNVTIPALFVSKEVGDLWISEINKASDVILRLAIEKDTRVFDASFDNSIVTHEFGHGVTIRLTGGRGTSNCLNSAEQMGEGWSDYFSLLFQIKAGDNGATPLGVGTYASGSTNLSEGIRQYPYSTDFNINPLTYAQTNTFFYEEKGVTKINEHKVGTVWASILWDLTWKLIDDYGFDANFSDTSSGNYVALNLIMNALKIQPCNPSFITGRNAILKADELLYNGKYSCLIWEAFSKRGVGLNASAGFNIEIDDIKDQIEDFTKPTDCVNSENFIPSNPVIKIYPNPVLDDLIINIPKYTSGIVVEVLDIHGRLITKQLIDNFSIITRLKLNELSKGMYFLRIKGDKINYQTKIIKK